MVIIHRRKFLQLGSLASASVLVPRFLKGFERQLLPEREKSLVVIQLSGGNDGLNTVIPYRNDIYYSNRPQLGISPRNVLPLTDELGLHPALTGMKSLYDKGELGILNAVGYPNPDRSHFRSMDIWQTGSEANEILTTGWIGRYLDAQCPGCAKPTLALEMDDTLSHALKGDTMTGIAVKNPHRLYATSNDPYFRIMMKDHPVDDDHIQVDYLYKTMAETMSSADYLYQQSNLYKSSETYPGSPLGKDLQTIAELIISGTNSRVYYVSLGSFDTHVNQQPQQQRLFAELSDAMTVFVSDLKKNQCFDKVMVMTFSEFGRRVSQNASAGTDHGTANCMFLVSGGLKKQGILNAAPDLANLEEGDLRYQVDFKDVYATMLRKWLDTDDLKILGKPHEYLRYI
ncbi:MAG TPA: DUF1501 domain-containing protein [Chitinophagaceae bacterium]|nr:DUF1501 domain-containing protein [Chitinophagaceae bacterium]